MKLTAVAIAAVAALNVAHAQCCYDESQKLRDLESDVQGLEIEQDQRGWDKMMTRKDPMGEFLDQQLATQRAEQAESDRQWQRNLERADQDMQREQLQGSLDQIAFELTMQRSERERQEQQRAEREWFTNAKHLIERIPALAVEGPANQWMENVLNSDPIFHQDPNGYEFAYLVVVQLLSDGDKATVESEVAKFIGWRRDKPRKTATAREVLQPPPEIVNVFDLPDEMRSALLNAERDGARIDSRKRANSTAAKRSSASVEIRP